MGFGDNFHVFLNNKFEMLKLILMLVNDTLCLFSCFSFAGLANIQFQVYWTLFSYMYIYIYILDSMDSMARTSASSKK